MLLLSAVVLCGPVARSGSGTASLALGFLGRCLLLLCFTALQSVDLGEGLVEGLALCLGDLELLGSGLARAVAVL